MTTRESIIQTMAKDAGISRKAATAAYATLMTYIKDQLTDGETFDLPLGRIGPTSVRVRVLPEPRNSALAYFIRAYQKL